MEKLQSRKEYMRDVYSKYWTHVRKRYGVIQYDKDLISELIQETKNGKILEVGIGDGQPYSQALSEKDYEMYGIDISPNHVEMVKNTFPNINVSVGDAEKLKFRDHFFDIVFCFRSTWYFSNITKAISEMSRVVKKGGVIMFDIQNINHPIHRKLMKEQIKREKFYIYEIALRMIKNLLKLLIRPIGFYPTHWSLKKHIILETPTDPSLIERYFKDNMTSFKVYGVDWNNQKCALIELITNKDLDKFDRLVYKVMN